MHTHQGVKPVLPDKTTFDEMYDFFFSAITDDMFMEMTKEDTEEMLEELLIAAMPNFEFPRWKDPFDLDLRKKTFTAKLSLMEMTIIRDYMIAAWVGQQLASVDLIRQKYSSSDYKFTSQAAHMKQLIALKKEYEQKGFHDQRLYSRREKDGEGRIRSSLYRVMDYPFPADGGRRHERT